jgi:uncharacterized Tic20 family protein
MTSGTESPEPEEPQRPAAEQPRQPQEPQQPQEPAAPRQPDPQPERAGQAPSPAQPPAPTPVPSGGYQPQPMSRDEEKVWAIVANLGPLIGLSFVVPLIVWLVFKDRSAFVDRQAKEALNMQISYFIYFAVAAILVIVVIGFFLLILLGVAWLVLMIIASVKAGAYEDYRYPAIIRFVS